MMVKLTCSAVASLLLWGIALANEVPPPTELEKAARERQARYERAVVSMTVKQVVEPPRVDAKTTLSFTNKLEMSGSNVRFENNQPHWNPSTRKPIEKRFELALTPSLCKYYHSYLLEDRIDCFGDISKQMRYDFLHEWNLFPLLLFLRGDSATLSPFKSFKLGARQRTIGESKCQEYSANLSTVPVVIWCDPTKENNAVRIESAAGAISEWHCDIEYRNTANHWLLSRWVFREFEVTIAQFDSDAGISDDRFQLTFPTDCIVFDHTSQQSDPSSGEPSPPTLSWWIKVLLGSAAGLLLIAFFWFRRRASRSTPSSG